MTEIKIKKIVIILGAVLACTAPYFHMIFPKKSVKIIALESRFNNEEITESQFNYQLSILKKEFKFIGFSSPRKFWFAIGKPIFMLYLGLFLFFIFPYINDTQLRGSTKILGILSTLSASYFIVWTLWYRGDFPRHWYYICIGLFSIASTFMAYAIINFRESLSIKISQLIRFISVDAYFKYIKHEDRDAYLQDSFTIYDQITKSKSYGSKK
ncbi:hypothetical protein MTsPCn5_19230 [Croceitalea sp. MTPC5]|uniref:hypothetical protein n=1 Tax=Croceitalea sp. MTPC5 TaxID=3056565 RepID=UPI002B3EA108|nr:hypothetical protein MTsPCn5_19230 [Croceitalea sp. MTPC5]